MSDEARVIADQVVERLEAVSAANSKIGAELRAISRRHPEVAARLARPVGELQDALLAFVRTVDALAKEISKGDGGKADG